MTPYHWILRPLAAGAAGLLLALHGCSPSPEQGEAASPGEPPASSSPRPTVTFGVVPQQSALELARNWMPLLEHLSDLAGVEFVFKTATDIPTFEARCEAGDYDVAYMNPYHYTVFHDCGYAAVAKRAGSKIRGILVKQRGAQVELADLHGAEVALPAPRAFAATLLTLAGLDQMGFDATPRYVDSHDSVYMNVARGTYPAGGGIMRTFRSTAPEVRAKLEILWESPGYTPHAFAVHERIDAATRDRIAAALASVDEDERGQALLKPLKIPGLEAAEDSDWDDVRALELRVR